MKIISFNTYIAPTILGMVDDGVNNYSEDQIDYILSNEKYKTFNRIDTLLELSDHYPIISTY